KADLQHETNGKFCRRLKLSRKPFALRVVALFPWPESPRLGKHVAKYLRATKGKERRSKSSGAGASDNRFGSICSSMPSLTDLREQFIRNKIEERLVVGKLQVAVGLRRLVDHHRNNRRNFFVNNQIVDNRRNTHVIRRNVSTAIEADQERISCRP